MDTIKQEVFTKLKSLTPAQLRKAFNRIPNFAKDHILVHAMEAFEDEAESNLKAILLNNRVIEAVKMGLIQSLYNINHTRS